MRKKILMILLAVVMTTAFMPAMAFAGSSSQAANETRWTFRGSSSDIETVRQEVIEVLDGAYSSSVSGQSRYIPAVWSEINAVYKTEVDRINNADSLEELIQYNELLGTQMVGEKTSQVVDELTYMGELTVQKVRSRSDLARLASLLKSSVRSSASKFRKSDYSAYYWDVFLDRKAAIYDEIAGISSYKAYADARIDVDAYFPESTGDSDDSDVSWLYTKAEMEMLRDETYTSVSDFVNDVLPVMGYKGEATAFSTMLADFAKELKGIQDYDSVAVAQKNVIVSIINKAGLKEGTDYQLATVSQKRKLAQQLEDIYYSYYSADYTSKGWSKIEEIYDDTLTSVDDLFISAQFSDSFAAKMKKKMDNVPTYKEELSAAKSKAVRALKKYKTSPRYSHKKVVKIANSGIAAVKKCSTITQVSSVLTSYQKKAARTIKKYKIITLKYGSGSVTRSASVKYGSAYKVRLMPKAGYRIASVRIDGKYVKLKYSYTFRNVKKNHKLSVMYSR